eukprot:5551539-Pyramimonas_sp.AAC.1
MVACVHPSQYSALRLHRELHRRPQWRRSHASAPPSTAFRGPIGSSTGGPSGDVRMRLRHPLQCFVAP